VPVAAGPWQSRDGHCQLCWQQARYQARLAERPAARRGLSRQGDGRLPYHQLFFDRMQVRRRYGPVHKHGRRGTPPKPPPAPAGRPACRWVQARLFEASRDFTRFDESTGADPGNPWLAWGLYLAWRRGEARGWKRGVRFGVRRALIIVLSRHEAGDTVRYSEIIPVQRALGISAARVAEVLQEMGVLDDDRRPSFEAGWTASSTAWPPASARTSRAGCGPCATAAPQRAPEHRIGLEPHEPAPSGAAGLVRPLRPPARGHPRRRRRRPRRAAGSRRGNVLVALRSLFAYCKKHKSIFRSPVRALRVGQHPYGIIQPLRGTRWTRQPRPPPRPPGWSWSWPRCTRPPQGHPRALLDDVDLGNRRLTIDGRTRPIDELTRKVLVE
jgi:hypothetical protein